MESALVVREKTCALPPFVYEPLDAENELRVLVLHPAESFRDPLTARLETQYLPHVKEALTKIPRLYEAVSYCWGVADREFDLACDGGLLKITHSVHTVLRYLRKKHRERTLWIDLVCINQNDHLEKAVQIGHMGSIFGGAAKVQAWLGEAWDSDEVERFFKIIPLFVCTEEENRGLDINHQQHLIDLIALTDLCLSLPWFRRRWILQEVVLGRCVVARCGKDKISWPWLSRAIKTMHIASKVIGDIGVSKGLLSRLEMIINLKGKADLDVASLLWIYHTTCCSEPRDRLLSLLAISSPYVVGYRTELEQNEKASMEIKVDCSKSWTEVFTCVADRYLNARLDVLVVHLKAFGSLHQQDHNWPSWVPSWNLERFSCMHEEHRTRRGGSIQNLHVTAECSTGTVLKGCLYEIDWSSFDAVHGPANSLLNTLQSGWLTDWFEQYEGPSNYHKREKKGYVDAAIETLRRSHSCDFETCYLSKVLEEHRRGSYPWWPSGRRPYYDPGASKAEYPLRFEQVLERVYQHIWFREYDGNDNKLFACISPRSLQRGDYIFNPSLQCPGAYASQRLILRPVELCLRSYSHGNLPKFILIDALYLSEPMSDGNAIQDIHTVRWKKRSDQEESIYLL